ncbi:MAG: hypothetical protein STSR0001_06440 [Methanothrix sp.]
MPDYYLQASSVDRRLISKISLNGKKLLNIGCGSHLISDIYFAMMGANVTSIDVDGNAIGIAEKKLSILNKKDPLDIRVLLEDGRMLPFSDGTFDVVVSFSAIEHMENFSDRIKAVEEMARVLKPGGYSAITGPNLLNLPVTFFSLRVYKRLGTHEHRYTPWELRRMLESCGLRIEEFDAESVSRVDKSLIEAKFPSMQRAPSALLASISFILKNFNESRHLKILGMRIGYLARKST